MRIRTSSKGLRAPRPAIQHGFFAVQRVVAEKKVMARDMRTDEVPEIGVMPRCSPACQMRSAVIDLIFASSDRGGATTLI